MIALEVKDLCVGYRSDVDVISNLSFEIKKGEILCLLGPSGCGKTTVLRVIAGFEDIKAGSVSLFGRVLVNKSEFIAPERRELGMMFQDYALFPHLNVEENIGFGLFNLSGSDRSAQVRRMMDLVRLPLDKLSFYPHELSGGQQQRVALARCLAPSPKLVLLDEPFSNLDVETRRSLAVECREILRSVNATSIVVTHNASDVSVISDYVGVMSEGGNIVFEHGLLN